MRGGAWIGASLLLLLLASAACKASAPRTGVACAVEVPTIDWLRAGITKCDAEPKHEGAVPIRWVLYPGEPLPGPNSNKVVVAVHELSCAGGRNPIPFLDKPEVDFLKRAVVIRLWIHPPEGANTCQGNPIGRLEVDLPHRLGERKLFDGSSNPPRRVKPGEDPIRFRPRGQADSRSAFLRQ